MARPEERGFAKTRQGMRVIAGNVATVKPDTIIIATPHGLRLLKKIAIVVTENSTGTLRTSPTRSVSLKAKCNVDLAMSLLGEAEAQRLPVVGANYGTFEGPTSDMPMDWGTLVPLWFILKERRVRARIVIVTPSREIPLRQNVEFGAVIARILEEKKGRKFVFVASADQAHTHAKSGPYGFNPAGARFDGLVRQAIEESRLQSLLRLDPKLVADAKPDSLWQMAILAGIFRLVKMQLRFSSYEVPTYYGMICAGFEKVR